MHIDRWISMTGTTSVSVSKKLGKHNHDHTLFQKKLNYSIKEIVAMGRPYYISWGKLNRKVYCLWSEFKVDMWDLISNW